MQKKQIPINADPEDPDWMYRSVLHGAFSGCSKTDKDVLGTRDDAEYTAQ